MAYKNRDRERNRQRLKRMRRQEEKRQWQAEMAMSEADKDIGQRLAEQFMRARATTVRDMEDLKRNTYPLALEERRVWERENGERIATYAYRRVDLSRVEELYRQRYDATRTWLQPRTPPPGYSQERIIKDAFLAIMVLLFLIGIAIKVSR